MNQMKRFENLVFCVVCLLANAASLLGQQPDAIYYNGSILTMAGPAPSYSDALAIQG